MSQPWWGRERSQDQFSRNAGNSHYGRQPILIAESPIAIKEELRSRRPHYTPDWEDPPDGDAGSAFVELFAFQFASIARRANRLPEKLHVDFLRLAGVRPNASRPAAAMVSFSVSPAAPRSVTIASGFQVGASSAGGDGEVVVFETQHGLSATAASIEKIIYDGARGQRDLTAFNAPRSKFAPFGPKPRVGDSLAIGLKIPQPRTRITDSLTFGFRIAAAPLTPTPSSSGGVAPIPLGPPTVLRWETRAQSQFLPLQVEIDETANLARSGIVQLRIPSDIDLTPTSHFGSEPLVWFRLQIVHGSFATPPQLSFVQANVARVLAVQTIRNEVLQPLDPRTGNQMQLQNTSVVADSLEIVSDESVLAGDGRTDQVTERRWRRVDDLETAGPNDDVYELDPTSGLVTFGDGHRGSRVPPGFRNVRAKRYEITRGAESAVGAEQITLLLNSAPFVTAVTNQFPTSGGDDQEPATAAIARGPETIRARNRSVTIADYAVMDRFAPGASVGRATAIPGYHPKHLGKSIAGVVGVLVVGDGSEAGPPVPDEQTLQSVTRYLSENVAPAGVEIVASAPRFSRVRAEVGFVAEAGTNLNEFSQQLGVRLTNYLHPLRGGADGEGWPFGGKLVFADLLNHLMTQDAASGYTPPRAIPRLRLVINGVPESPCLDISLDDDELFWPENHQIVPIDMEGDG